MRKECKHQIYTKSYVWSLKKSNIKNPPVILHKGFEGYIKTWFRKAQFIWLQENMHLHMMQSMCSVNSICFNNLSFDHILLHKTRDHWAWINIYYSSKCILKWCKPCMVCELNRCELSSNQEVSYWDNKQHCLAWLTPYNIKVYVYINKLLCNKNNIKLILD